MSRGWMTLLLASCSAPIPPAPPVIDSVDMPATATVDAGGKAALVWKVTYHDPDDYVSAVTLRVKSTAQETTGKIDPPVKNGSTMVTTSIPGMKGTTVDVEIWVTDLTARTSLPVSRTVMLQ